MPIFGLLRGKISKTLRGKNISREDCINQIKTIITNLKLLKIKLKLLLPCLEKYNQDWQHGSARSLVRAYPQQLNIRLKSVRCFELHMSRSHDLHYFSNHYQAIGPQHCTQTSAIGGYVHLATLVDTIQRWFYFSLTFLEHEGKCKCARCKYITYVGL